MVRRRHPYRTYWRRTPLSQATPAQGHVFHLHQRLMSAQQTKVFAQHVRFCWKMPRKRSQKKMAHQKITPTSLHHPNRIRRQRTINLRRHGQKQKRRQLVPTHVRTTLNQTYFYHYLGFNTLIKKCKTFNFLYKINNLSSKIGTSFNI